MTTIRFKFNLLTPEVYDRFVELIIPKNIDNFIRTNKKNHINLFKLQGILVTLNKLDDHQKPFRYENGRLKIDNTTEERYLEALESLPRFVPYLKYRTVHITSEFGPLPYPKLKIPDRTTVRKILFRHVRKEYYINDIEYIYSTFYHEKLFYIRFGGIDLKFGEIFEFIEYVLGKMPKVTYIRFSIPSNDPDIIRFRSKLIKIPNETHSFSIEFPESITSENYVTMYVDKEWYEGYEEE